MDPEPLSSQDQILRGLTHKMNNILSLFHGYLGMLMEDQKMDANTKSGLTRIRDGAYSASELMDRVQALIRPRNLVIQEVHLSEVFQHSKRGLEALASRGITVEFPNAEQLPTVLAEASRFRAMLSEVVANAIEASPDYAAVKIGIRIEPAIVTVSVSDSGPEIPPATMSRLFEPFFSTRQKRNAFGLGLSICTEIAAQLNGSIAIERVGKATVCSIRLPRCGE